MPSDVLESHTLVDPVGVAAAQSEGSNVRHGIDDLTTTKPVRQTGGHESANHEVKSTSADVHQRPLASAQSRLIDRLDKAMKEAGTTGAKLAQALGITPQSLTNMRRKANAGMRAELLAHAADFLQCDLHWLCTGEGGDYVPARNLRKLIVAEYAAWLAELSDDDLLRAFAMVTNLRQGFWPPAA